MPSSFNPETVSSLPCYKDLLRVQVLLSCRSPASLFETFKSLSVFLWFRGSLILSRCLTLFTCLACALTCSTVVSLLSLSVFWGTAVFLRSQVVSKGGIQFQERCLIGWFGKFGWVFYPLSYLGTFFNFAFSASTFRLLSSSGIHQRGMYLFFYCILTFTPVSFLLLLRRAWQISTSAGFMQPEHRVWVWAKA